MELAPAGPVLDPPVGAVEVDDNVGGVVLDADGEAVLLEVDDGFGVLVGFGGFGGFGGLGGGVGCVDEDAPLDDVGLDDEPDDALDDEDGVDEDGVGEAVELGAEDDDGELLDEAVHQDGGAL